MKNLNLSPIKAVIVLWTLLTLSVTVSAQSKNEFTLGASITGGLGWAINSGSNYKIYTDTVGMDAVIHINKGFHIWADRSLGRKADVQFGLGFLQTGFSKHQSQLDHGDYTYPGIGEGVVLDKSNVERGIRYNYNYNYLEIPVLFNVHLSHSANNKWVNHLSAGLTPQFLISHKMVAECDAGYSIDGETKFKLDSTGFDARFFNLALQAGLYIEYHKSKSQTIFFQPLFGICPIGAATSDNQSIPYYLNLTVGLKFSSLKNED